MNNMRKLAATFISAAAIAALFTVAASAETRHREETTTTTTTTSSHNDRNWRRDGQTQTQQQQYNNRGTRNYDRSNADRNYGQRSNDRNYNNNNTNRSYDRNYGRSETRNYDRNYNRNDTRNYDRNYGRSEVRSYDRGRTNDGYRNDARRFDARGRAWYPSEGRVSRFVHESGGYRVWISGGRYPVWIPEARWRLFPLRVGLSIRFGGWLDPLGYIDAYEYGPLGGPLYGAPVYSSGEIRGVVENVDYGRGTLVLRDDNTGNYVTAIMRDRSMGNLRPGDFVALSGDWTRAGVFEAYRLNDIQGAY